MKIKVCGMRDPQNIKEIALLKPDFMGFIFFPPSPRFVRSDEGFPQQLLTDICSTGVFVNEKVSVIETIIRRFRLNAVQLHGNESVELCRSIRRQGIQVLKAIPVAEKEDFEKLERFSGEVDYLVFDTKTSRHGGSGTKFDWELLNAYQADIPFLLGGGINEQDLDAFRKISHPMLAGVDVNSGFENSPGVKDAAKVRRFIENLHLENFQNFTEVM